MTYAPLGPQYGAMQSLDTVHNNTVWLNMIHNLTWIMYKTRVVYHFYTGSLAGIRIDVPYAGTRWSVFWLVFLGVSKILADVMI